jgi:hypothetical protein
MADGKKTTEQIVPPLSDRGGSDQRCCGRVPSTHASQ